VKRQTFIAGTLGLLAAPLAAEAQQGAKVYRMGILETRSIDLNAANLAAFRHALLTLGYKEDQHFTIAYRSSDGHDDLFPGLVSELVGLKVDLILTRVRPRRWRPCARLEPFRWSWRLPAIRSAPA
jgi:hypothetical protein